MRNSYEWQAFRKLLYKKGWCPYIKETFNGFGNEIEYLGRYTHRIAITNARIRSVSETHTTFATRDYRTGEMRDIMMENTEFIRRFLMHVLPSGFQKIRYYSFLNNRLQESEAYFQAPTVSEIQGMLFRDVHGGTPEGGVGL